MTSSLYAGIDSGSRAIKIALFDAERSAVVATDACDQGLGQASRAEALLKALLVPRGLAASGLAGIVATGYGRHAISLAKKTITEITCHAAGVRFLHPDAAALIDIGGQDSKFVHLHADGRVLDFAMNDRCAAGTGRFLEVVSQRLDVPLDRLGERAEQAERPAAISSMCVVFAESEIIGLLASGETIDNIVAGVQRSIAGRVAAMAGRVPEGLLVFTGGVARISGMRTALAQALGREVQMASDPCMTGAIGAALLAAGA
jgi:predicted CoA-substrate-specific enzyme activase